MAKPALDSDLYGDIYGDDDNEFAVPLDDTEDWEESLTENEKPSLDNQLLNASSSHVSTTSISQDPLHSLPAKPQPSDSGSLSYSAQIAQQFSAYQQTPSQERQQRVEIPLPPNPRQVAGTSAIATHETSTPNPGTSNSVFGKKPSEMHDSGKLFIGGLNWDTTDEGLRSYFSQFGKVDACTIMRDPSGTSRGFAFLTFEDADAINAVVVREHFLDGKAIDPKRAIPREEHLRNTRYFVGGLAATSTSDSMREFFAAYGKVVDATVMVDRESGRSKGFGFVTFEDASNADQLVGKSGLIMDDKQIEVKMAQPRSQRDQVRTTGAPASGRDTAFNDRGPGTASPNMTFPVQPINPMSLLYQRPMGQIPMMGGNVPMMSMNPMAMAMGMGMSGFNPMGGMNAMGMINGMNPMGTMNNMNNIGAMRLGMGPMGVNGMGQANSAMVGINPLGMGLRSGIGGMSSGLSPGIGRMAMNVGPGPSRLTSRGQHNFHPYSR